MTTSNELKNAAVEMRELAAKADTWPCPEWTYQAVRHIARNCDVECNHNEYDEKAEAWVHHDCPVPDGSWDRYNTSAHIQAWSPTVAVAVADLLDQLAAWLDEGYDDNWPPFAAAWSVAQAWVAGHA